MAAHGRNEYLDFGSDDDADLSEVSERVEESRTARLVSGRSRKRKLSHDSLEDELGGESSENADILDIVPEVPIEKQSELVSSNHANLSPKASQPLRPSKPALKKQSKPGIVYISRIPPYLKPQTLRHLFSVHGTITNLFLTPEAPAAYHNRVHTHHGNKKRQYIDGWVEFKHKRHAKACVDALNGRTTAEGLGVGGIGGRKGGKGRWYRDDVWSVKYLRGFTWGDLMQSAQAEEREREERVRVGVMREKRERQAFVAGVQGAKVEETRRKKQKRKLSAAETDGGEGSKKMSKGVPGEEIKAFKQNEVWHPGKKNRRQSEDITRVLSKIF